MNKHEFYQLLDKWTETPEYKEYEAICFESDTLQKQLANGEKIIRLFNEAINNEYGKQIVNEPMFLELFYRGL